MSLSKLAVSRPVTVLIVFSLIILLGAFVVMGIPVDLYPDIDPPILVVSTYYPGAGPEDVEETVSRHLEGFLSNVSDLEDITSTSSEGSSIIVLEFSWEKDMSEAANDVRDKLEFAKRELPDGAETPALYRFDPAMMPILYITIQGAKSSEELRAIGEDIIQPQLEQVSGVALTGVRGGRETVIRADVSKNRLDAYGLTLTQVSNALASQNIDMGGGTVSSGTYDYFVRSEGDFKSVDEVRNVAIAYKTSSSGKVTAIRLKDIAEVTEGLEDETSTVFINGENGVYVMVQKQSDANSVQTANNVIAKLEEINKSLPKGVSATVLSDNTKIIKDSIAQVGSSAVTGGILAMVVLFVFLRSIRSTFIIGISIPVSLLVTMMGMFFTGMTINILSLAGLTLGVGMIVDSSIVILENIFRYREKGSRMTVSAVLGSEEMKGAIVASTLTTVCVFLPIVLFKSQLGIMGILFNDLAFTVIVALLSSLFIALILVPMLSSHYLGLYTKAQRPIKNAFLKKIDDRAETGFVSMEKAYRKILSHALKKRKTTIATVVITFVFFICLIPIVGIEFTPQSGEDVVTIAVELPPGTKLEIAQDVMNRLEEIVKKEVSAYTNIVKSAGGSQSMLSESEISYIGELSVYLPSYSERTDTSEDIKTKLRPYFDQFPGVTFAFESGGGGGPGASSPIDILIKSDNLEKIGNIANTIKSLIEEKVPDATEVDTSISSSLPEIGLVFNREKMYELGLNATSVGQEVRAAIDGIRPTTYRAGDDEFDVLLVLREEDRQEFPDLRTIHVANSTGGLIPVSSFASLQVGTGPVDIERMNQTRIVHVTANLEKGAKLSEVQGAIEKIIEENIIPDDAVIIEYSGDTGELRETGVMFLGIIIVALLLVYGVMASQFESFKDPFIMFLSVPLMMIGVVLVHLLAGTPFSVFTAVGVIMLAGIVVNNGIVLVDYINLLVKRGHTLKEACVEGGVSRLRPILMTTLTTVFGMIPMAFIPGEGSELVQPIGQAVVGGLTTSTIITLVFVPVMYYVFNAKEMKGRL